MGISASWSVYSRLLTRGLGYSPIAVPYVHVLSCIDTIAGGSSHWIEQGRFLFVLSVDFRSRVKIEY